MTHPARIIWHDSADAEWRAVYDRTFRPTLLQDPAYLKAMSIMNSQQARFGIIEIGGTAAGTVSMLEAKAFGRLMHAVIIDRGPCWLEGRGTAHDWQQFFAAVDRDMPKRFMRKRRILLEMTDSPAGKALVAQAGWQRMDNIASYQTMWVSLQGGEAAWREHLRTDFRQRLNKADKAGLRIVWDKIGTELPELLRLYGEDKAARGYPGPAPTTVLALCAGFGPAGQLRIGKVLAAEDDKTPLAYGLFFLHGRAATYQVGWVGAEGRRHAANHYLLWQALHELQQAGITDLDLGGINDEEATSGITAFKGAFGGQRVALVGAYH